MHYRAMVHTVTLLTREGAGARLEVTDVDHAADRELAAEYGDRLPVVLVDGAEHSCWEVDDDELLATLAGAGPFPGWD